MRHLIRLQEPDILANKKDKWQKAFEEKLKKDAKARPDSSKYAHPDITDRLWAISHGKCFYCEASLLNVPKEVDHYLEVHNDHSKAYVWENLYLACQKCNDKIDSKVIPLSDVLDPFVDTDSVISENIYFDKEEIGFMPGATKGEKTIQKYKLDSERQDALRTKHLQTITQKILELVARMAKDGRRKFDCKEKMALRLMCQTSAPYSLMTRQYIENLESIKGFM